MPFGTAKTLQEALADPDLRALYEFNAQSGVAQKEAHEAQDAKAKSLVDALLYLPRMPGRVFMGDTVGGRQVPVPIDEQIDAARDAALTLAGTGGIRAVTRPTSFELGSGGSRMKGPRVPGPGGAGDAIAGSEGMWKAVEMERGGAHPDEIFASTGFSRDAEGGWAQTPPPPRPDSPPMRGPDKQIVGAPRGVMNAEQEAQLRQNYLGDVEKGIVGRDWYKEAGTENLANVGGDKDHAVKLTGYQSVTSSNTPVDANLGHAIKANNQVAVGDPISGIGQYPKKMSKKAQMVADSANPTEVYDALGKKQTPYAQNIAAGGGYGPPGTRSVHDVWDSRAHGYSEREVKSGMKPLQHNWMDNQQRQIIDAANDTNLGGFKDWDESSTQAASWVGKKSGTEGTSPEAAARSYKDFWDKRYAQDSYESAPGKGTDHIPGLRDAPMPQRQQHMDDVAAIMNNNDGRDLLGLGFGGLVGKSVKGPGVFTDATNVLNTNPGVQARIAVGRVKGGETLDPASERLLGAISFTRSQLLGQDAFAWHVRGNIDPPLKRTGIIEFALGRPINDAEMKRVIEAVKQHMTEVPLNKRTTVNLGAHNTISPIVSPNGFRLVLHGGGDPISPEMRQAFAKAGNDIHRDINAAGKANYAEIGKDFQFNDWTPGSNKRADAYLKYLNSPQLVASFNKTAPDIARDLYELDEPLAKMYGGPAVSQVQKLRQVIMEGGDDALGAVLRAIKGGYLSVGAVGLMLGVAGQKMGAGPEGSAPETY